MKTLAERVDELAAHSPGGLAFAAGEQRMTWSQYRDRANRLAREMDRLGVPRGARVAVLLPDGPGVHAVYLALEKAGLVTMGIGPRAGRAELDHLLRKSGARVLVSRPLYRELDMASVAREAGLHHHIVVPGELDAHDPLFVDGAEVAADGATSVATPCAPANRPLDTEELFLLNSTSGTTGMPKCVMHHQARWNHFHALAVAAAALEPSDVFLSAIPAPFGFGLWTAHFTPTLLGAPCVVLPSFAADAMIREIERHRVTILAAVSTQFVMMLGSEALDGADLGSLRVLFTGGEAVPYERALEFEERCGARVLQFYGSNETGALSHTALSDSRETRLRSAGHVIPSMEVRLFEELATGRTNGTASGRGIAGCRGPLTSRGYYADDEANAELVTSTGWMLTGDICTIDADGVLRVAGRSGDFIIRGGKNISAAAVEEAVGSHPVVELAAAVAMPDPIFGERVCVYAQLRRGGALELDALLDHLRERDVSAENLPERLLVVDEIPRSSGGKIAKAALREDIRGRLRQEGARARIADSGG